MRRVTNSTQPGLAARRRQLLRLAASHPRTGPFYRSDLSVPVEVKWCPKWCPLAHERAPFGTTGHHDGVTKPLVRALGTVRHHGRRAFRIRCPKGRGGSTPPSRTTSDLRIFARNGARKGSLERQKWPPCSRLLTEGQPTRLGTRPSAMAFGRTSRSAMDNAAKSSDGSS